MFDIGGDEIIGTEINSSLQSLREQYDDVERCIERISSLISHTNQKRLSFSTIQRLKFSKATHQMRSKRLSKLISDKQSMRGAERAASCPPFRKSESHVNDHVRFNLPQENSKRDNGAPGTWVCLMCKQTNAENSTRCKGCANFAPFQRTKTFAKGLPVSVSEPAGALAKCWECQLCQSTNLESAKTCVSCNGWVCIICKLTNSTVERYCRDCREKKPTANANVPARRFGSTPRERLDSSGSLGVALEKKGVGTATSRANEVANMNIMAWLALSNIPSIDLVDVLEDNNITTPGQLLGQLDVAADLSARLKVVQQSRLRNALISLKPGSVSTGASNLALSKLTKESKDEYSGSVSKRIPPSNKPAVFRSASEKTNGNASTWTCRACQQSISNTFDSCSKCHLSNPNTSAFTEMKKDGGSGDVAEGPAKGKGGVLLERRSLSNADAYRQLQTDRRNSNFKAAPRICVTPPPLSTSTLIATKPSRLGSAPPTHTQTSLSASVGGGIKASPRSASPHPSAYLRQQEAALGAQSQSRFPGSTSFAPLSRPSQQPF